MVKTNDLKMRKQNQPASSVAGSTDEISFVHGQQLSPSSCSSSANLAVLVCMHASSPQQLLTQKDLDKINQDFSTSRCAMHSLYNMRLLLSIQCLLSRIRDLTQQMLNCSKQCA